MKLWKGVTFAFVLCGAALSIVFVRNMATIGQFRPKSKYPYTSPSSSRLSSFSQSTFKTSPQSPSSSSSSSSSSAESAVKSRQMGGPQRRPRSADEMNSVLSEFSAMFQSFTEGELRHVVGALLDRKRRKSRLLGENQARRTKRARRPKPCSLRELELTVSELGLGYDSDETLLLRYCSGKCLEHRQNYDLTMDHMVRTGFKKKGRKDKVSNGPCCRPIAYEKQFSFQDNKHLHHTVRNMSAKNCGCV
ncbi:hypothetical protein NQZ68_001310 [Dissostichus eleginoides]|uniref:Neurturin n=1 Tax=Dissostichus eleginoides TaxID=100907 RepID=A0AAD9B7U8_DISEL|nr:hypothetical protein NQZ68_001310 [Dissostichus eleginoides]KAK1878775.1 Neurturin [Dissostichus eleginoides]